MPLNILDLPHGQAQESQKGQRVSYREFKPRFITGKNPNFIWFFLAVLLARYSVSQEITGHFDTFFFCYFPERGSYTILLY